MSVVPGRIEQAGVALAERGAHTLGEGAFVTDLQVPAFFDSVPRIRLRDPLAQLLGAAGGGVLEYGYADAVRLAGHSCPTVASAYWLGVRALTALYPEALPVRGQIRVELRESVETGTIGVVANVLSLLTGAASVGGFKGLGGQYVRRDLLRFDAPIETDLRFTRTDTGAAINAQAHPQRVAGNPRTMPLLQRCVAGQASAA
ncbi:MAG: hypothetical protein ABIP61_15830, partial [Burkholderiaceae bacterium]